MYSNENQPRKLIRDYKDDKTEVTFKTENDSENRTKYLSSP